MTQHHLMVGSYGSSELTTKIFVDYYLDCLFFLSHHAALGSLLFCILYAKCCASGCILLLFPHLIPCDYGPHGMCHSDPGLQSIQLNWSKDMLVRVQPVYLDYLDS